MNTNRIVKGHRNRSLVAASALSLTLWAGLAGADLIECPNLADPAASDIPESCNGLAITCYGTAEDDIIVGTDFDDVIHSMDGWDTIESHGGDDTICAGSGQDFVKGGGGADTVFAGPGDDRVEGGPGEDTLVGDYGNDILSGGKDDDYLDGGDGTDWLDGGGGEDECYAGPDGEGDLIADCELGTVSDDPEDPPGGAKGKRTSVSN
jgi:Ca2+-binding RTX toxin-like protein